MWYVGQRYQFTKDKQSNSGLLRHTDKGSNYKIADSIYVIATPRLFGLSQLNDGHYLYFSNFSTIIVIDSAVETNSHSLSLKKALYTHAQVHKLDVNNNGSSPCDTYLSFTTIKIKYLYFPLLDLQSLREVAAQDFIHLFKQIDALANDTLTNEASANIDIGTNITKKQLPSNITLINFQCVMGLSRSVALHALYLIYQGQLTADNYVTWINEQYPKAHINDSYLPKSLVNEVGFLAKNT